MPRHKHKKPSSKTARKHLPASEEIDPGPPLLHVYATSTCSTPRYRHHHLHLSDSEGVPTAEGPLCGYALIVPEHNVRIAEPVPGGPQNHTRADLAALHAALELIHGLRAREAMVYIRSTRLVSAYEDHGDTPDDPPSLARHDARVWQAVAALRATLADRGVNVTVLTYPPPDPNIAMELPIAPDAAEKMRDARRLARHATHLHVRCPLCMHLHGRQFRTHDCRPVCQTPPCDGTRVYVNVAAYKKHVIRAHARKCQRIGCEFFAMSDDEMQRHVEVEHAGRGLECEFCGRGARSDRALRRHIRKRCHEAPRCPECDKRFETMEELEKHMRRTGMLSEPGDTDHERDRFRRRRHQSMSMLSASTSSTTSSFTDDERDMGMETGLPIHRDEMGREWEVDEFGYKTLRRTQSMHAGFGRPDGGHWN